MKEHHPQLEGIRGYERLEVGVGEMHHIAAYNRHQQDKSEYCEEMPHPIDISQNYKLSGSWRMQYVAIAVRP